MALLLQLVGGTSGDVLRVKSIGGGAAPDPPPATRGSEKEHEVQLSNNKIMSDAKQLKWVKT